MEPLALQPARRTWLGGSLRYIAPILVTVAALAAALTHVDMSALVPAARQLGLYDVAIVVAALTVGALLASLRLQMIARDLGYPIQLRDAVAALSLGQIAGSLFFQVIGQTAARGAFLARRGMPFSGMLVMTGYERLAALLVSLVLALIGAWVLFGRITLDLERGGAEFARLAVGIVLAALAGAVFAWGRDAAAQLRRVAGPQATGRIARVVALSVLIQLATMAAYMTAAAALAPGVSIEDMAAASAVVMLAAALPISLAGWGIRELSAIYALGIIGLPKEAALVVAVVVGVAALLVVGILAIASLGSRRDSAPMAVAAPPPIDYRALLGWSVPIAAATMVFFQIHVPLSGAPLNVNLADPVALVGGLLFAAGIVRARKLPAWRLPGLSLHLGLMTAVLLLAFLHGWWEWGWSRWAFANRLAGWFVLLAYLATGALIAGRNGLLGFTLLARTFAAVALVLVALDVVIFIVIVLGYQVPMEIIRYRIDGFAQNANAFALQLILALAILLSAPSRMRGEVFVWGIAFLGLWLTGSKAGLVAGAVVLMAAIALGAVRIPRLVTALCLAAAAVLVINWLPEFVFAVSQAGKAAVRAVTAWFCASCAAPEVAEVLSKRSFSSVGVVASGYELSRVERVASLQAAWQMFLDHPVFGAGLGAFLETYARTTGAPLVIHSTPLWLMAEAGVIGLLIFAAPFVRVLGQELAPARRQIEPSIFLVLALVGFAVMASIHDLLYQRSLWLLAGAALALTRAERPA